MRVTAREWERKKGPMCIDIEVIYTDREHI